MHVELRVVEGMWIVWPMWGDCPEVTEALELTAEHVRGAPSNRTRPTDGSPSA